MNANPTAGTVAVTRLGRAVQATVGPAATAPVGHRERHRQTNWLRDVILGGQDGLVNILGIILGVIAGGGSTAVLLAAGFAAAITESISMGAVGYTPLLPSATTTRPSGSQDRISGPITRHLPPSASEEDHPGWWPMRASSARSDAMERAIRCGATGTCRYSDDASGYSVDSDSDELLAQASQPTPGPGVVCLVVGAGLVQPLEVAPGDALEVRGDGQAEVASTPSSTVLVVVRPNRGPSWCS